MRAFERTHWATIQKRAAKAGSEVRVERSTMSLPERGLQLHLATKELSILLGAQLIPAEVQRLTSTATLGALGVPDVLPCLDHRIELRAEEREQLRALGERDDMCQGPLTARRRTVLLSAWRPSTDAALEHTATWYTDTHLCPAELVVDTRRKRPAKKAGQAQAGSVSALAKAPKKQYAIAAAVAPQVVHNSAHAGRDIGPSDAVAADQPRQLTGEDAADRRRRARKKRAA